MLGRNDINYSLYPKHFVVKSIKKQVIELSSQVYQLKLIIHLSKPTEIWCSTLYAVESIISLNL